MQGLTPSLDNFTLPATVLATDTLELAADADSGLPIEYAVVEGPAELLEGNLLAFNDAGEVTIEARQEGNTLWAPAETISVSLTVERQAQMIDFPPLDPSPANLPVTLQGSATSGLPVAFTVIDGPGSIADSNTLHFTAAGDVVVEARQEGNARWQGASAVTRTVTGTVVPADVLLASLEKTYTGSPVFPEVDTLPAGLSITWDTATPPVEVGSYTVTAVVDDPIYEGQASAILTITQAPQAIDFPVIEDQALFGTLDLNELEITATSGLPVSLAVVEGEVDFNEETGLLTFTHLGTITVEATQGGDANWAAAAPVSRTFHVEKAMAGVTLHDLDQAFDGTPRAVSVTTVPENLTVDILYDGSSTPPTERGLYEVTATVIDDDYQGSASATLSIGRGRQTIDFPPVPDQLTTDLLVPSASVNETDLPVSFSVVSGPAEREFAGGETYVIDDSYGPWGGMTQSVLEFSFSEGTLSAANQNLPTGADIRFDNERAFETDSLLPTIRINVAGETRLRQLSGVKDFSSVLWYDPDQITDNSDQWRDTWPYPGNVWVVKLADGSLYKFQVVAYGDRLPDSPGPTPLTGLTFQYGRIASEEPEEYRFVFTGAGPVTLAADQSGDDEWNPAGTVTQSFMVDKAPATITLSDLTHTYDGSPKQVTAVPSVEGLTVNIDYDGQPEPPNRAGEYAVTATIDDPLYQGSAEATLTIAPQALTVSNVSVSNKVYDGTTDAVILSADLVGAVSGDDVALDPDSFPATFAQAVPGEAIAVTTALSLSGEDAENYTLIQPDDVTASITRRPLSLPEIVIQTRAYDETTAAAVVDFGPFGAGEVISGDMVFLDTGAVIATFAQSGAGTDIPVTVSGLTLDGADAGNYLLSDPVASGTIEPAFAFALDTDLQVIRAGEPGAFSVEVTLGEGPFSYQWYRDGELIEGETASTLAWPVVAHEDDSDYTVAISHKHGTVVSEPMRLSVDRGAQTLTFAELADVLTTDTVTLDASSSVGLPVDLAILAGPAEWESANVLRFTGAGEVLVIASQAGNEKWLPAPDVVRSFEVTKTEVEQISFSGLSPLFTGGPHEAGVETLPAGLSVDLLYDGVPEAPVDVGSYTVEATVDDAIYTGTATATMTIGKGVQEIVFDEIPDVMIDEILDLSDFASATSGLPVGFQLDGPVRFDVDEPVEVLSGYVGRQPAQFRFSDERFEEDEVQMSPVDLRFSSANGDDPMFFQLNVSAAGNARILELPEGSGFGNINWYSPDAVQGHSVTVSSFPSSLYAVRTHAGAVYLMQVVSPPETYGRDEIIDQIHLLIAPVNSQPPASPGVTFTDEGEITVTALQAGDTSWQSAAPISRTFAVTKYEAQVELGNLEQIYDSFARTVAVQTDPPELVLATEVSYNGSTEPPRDVGSYQVIAEIDHPIWKGQAEATLEILPGLQEIQFEALPDANTADQVLLQASAESGLPVVFSVLDGPAEIVTELENTYLRFTGAGVVTVEASQPGGANWGPASPAFQQLNVAKLPSHLLLENQTKTYTGSPIYPDIEFVAGFVPDPVFHESGWLGYGPVYFKFSDGTFQPQFTGEMNLAFRAAGTGSFSEWVEVEAVNGARLLALPGADFDEITWFDPDLITETSLTVAADPGEVYLVLTPEGTLYKIRITEAFSEPEPIDAWRSPSVDRISLDATTLPPPAPDILWLFDLNPEPPTGVGEYRVDARLDDLFYEAPDVTSTLLIAPRQLTLPELAVADKLADGSTAAVVTEFGGFGDGEVIGGDAVSLSTVNAQAYFSQAEPGQGLTVTVTGLMLDGADAGNYQLGSITTTANIVDNTPIEVEIAPSANIIAPAGTEVVLEAVVTAGDPPFEYQWTHDEQILEGETGETLTLSDAALVDEGEYRVQVSNIAGSGVSAPASVSVGPRAEPVTLLRPEEGELHVAALLANDVSADGEPLEVTGISDVDAGGFSVDLDGETILYGPDETYSAPVTFTYTITDSRGLSDEAEVRVLNFAGGDGTEENPFEVASPAQLEMLRSHGDGYFVLTSDIDLSGLTWEPLPAFSGNLNGQGFDIRNLLIDLPLTSAAGGNVGLFREVTSQGAIHGVNLVDVDVYGGRTVGALAGRNFGRITTSSVTGNVTARRWLAGGLAGENHGEIHDCWTDVEVRTEGDSDASGFDGAQAGGLVGRNEGLIRRASASGIVSLSEPYTTAHLGGLVGLNFGEIERGFANVTVTGWDRVGGLVGGSSGTEALIRESYAAGSVTGREFVGGLVGVVSAGSGYSEIIDSGARASVVGIDRVGGLIGWLDHWGSLTRGYASGSVSLNQAPPEPVVYTYARNADAPILFNFDTGEFEEYWWLEGQTAGYHLKIDGEDNWDWQTDNPARLIAVEGSQLLKLGLENDYADIHWFDPGLVDESEAWIDEYPGNTVIVKLSDTRLFKLQFATAPDIEDFGSVTIGNTQLRVTPLATAPDEPVVTDDPDGLAGGLIGSRGLGPVTQSYWNIETTGRETSAGGEARDTAAMSYPFGEDTYAGWDFEEIWTAAPDLNEGYPLPALRRDTQIDLQAQESVAEAATWQARARLDGSGPFSFQWLKDGVAIEGAIAAEFTLGVSRAEDAGEYTLEVTDLFGETTTATVSLSVGPPVPIVAEISTERETVPVGSDAMLEVTILAGDGPFEYEWTKDGIPLAGETGPTLHLTHADINATEGEYRVNVANHATETLSDALSIQVGPRAVAETVVVGPSGEIPVASLLANALSADGSELIVSDVFGLTEGAGTIALHDSTILIDVNESFGGDIRFSYRIRDSRELSDTAEVTVISLGDGDGSPENPYQIGSSAQFNNLRFLETGHVVLTGNIELDPAADMRQPLAEFSGVFDGQGYEIRHLRIDQRHQGAEAVDVGLWRELSAEAVVRNLSLVDVEVYGDRNVGALAGRNHGTVENVRIDGTVTARQTTAGGITGSNEGTITESEATVNVTVQGSQESGESIPTDIGSRAGGIAGFNAGTIRFSISHGEIRGVRGTIAGSVGMKVGGLVGEHRGTIEQSASKADVEGHWIVGGLVGRSDGGTISNSYARGPVSGASMIGGLAGLVTDSSHTIHSFAVGEVGSAMNANGLVGIALTGSADIRNYWNTESSGRASSPKGEGRDTAAMTYPYAEDTYVDWDFETVWVADTSGEVNDGYPYLRMPGDLSGPQPVDYTDWAQAIPHPELRGDHHAPMGDNIPNLIKFASGLDPTKAHSSVDVMRIYTPGGAIASSSSSPQFEVQGQTSSSTPFAIVFYRSKTAAGVQIRPEYTDDLNSESWGYESVTQEKIGEEGDREIWKATAPKTGERGFMRLRVERDPPQ